MILHILCLFSVNYKFNEHLNLITTPIFLGLGLKQFTLTFLIYDIASISYHKISKKTPATY
ncbi:MAG: hypothetical protein RIT27_1086 [Pseudomonadota bacterium]|jgi:hypothetical protein